MVPPPILAFDVDLHAVYGWTNVPGAPEEGVVCDAATEIPLDAVQAHARIPDARILVEVAAPFNYMKKGKRETKASTYHKNRWRLFNTWQAVKVLQAAVEAGLSPDRVLVATSTSWTNRHPDANRHTLAGCAGWRNHDLREARSMVYCYRSNPGDWTPIDEFFRAV